MLDVLYNLTIELTTRADNLMIELTFQDFYLNIVPSSSTFLHIVTLNPCDMTHSYAWHDLCVCATWRILPRHQSSSWVIITFEPMIMTLLNIWLCVTCHDSIHVCDVSQFQIAPALSLHTQWDIQKRHTTWQDLMLVHMLTCKHRYSMRLLCAWDALNISPYSMQLLCHHSICQHSICQYHVIRCSYSILWTYDISPDDTSPYSMHLPYISISHSYITIFYFRGLYHDIRYDTPMGWPRSVASIQL